MQGLTHSKKLQTDNNDRVNKYKIGGAFMNRLFYPAIFEKEEDGYSVHFPDIEGCNTEGNSIEEAYEMAVDALGLIYLAYKDDLKQPFPKASNPQDIKTVKGQTIVLIDLDIMAYRKKYETKAVKKTLSIPSWLNDLAIQKNINFSNVLQEALKEKLKLTSK